MSADQEVDFLEVDQPIPGQNYVCLSFISPEKVIKQKEVFFMKKFLQDLLTDENKRNYLLNLDLEKLTYEKVNDMVEDFRIVKEKEVNDEFDETVDFQTSVRGVKVRGVYDTMREAKIRSSILQKGGGGSSDGGKFSIFIGQIGYWLPWDPANTDNIDSEYQEQQLNELMKNYKINAEQRDMFYQQEKQERVDAAIKDNLKKKQEAAQKGDLDLSKDPNTSDQTEKIGEFREILDEKDKIFQNVVNQGGDNDNAGGTQQAAIIADDTKPDDDFSSGGFADPWVKRKTLGEEELPPPSNDTETMSHNANDVSGNTDNNLKEVTKNIF